MKPHRPTPFWAILLTLAFSTLAYSASQAPVLKVLVTGGKPDTGQFILTVFSNKENYLKAPVHSKTLPVGKSGQCRFILDNLSKGTYAISVIYDEDSDGELKTGFMGIPKELVGMSNNAKGRFGPPSFEKTSFLLSESTEIEIRLDKAK